MNTASSSASAVSPGNLHPASAPAAAPSNLVFLNGRQQIIDMLKLMPAPEKAALLDNLKKRNPILANELLEESINFSCLENLSQPEIELIFSFTDAFTWGVALQGLTAALQRKILGLATRPYAEQAFKVMTGTPGRSSDVAKAQNKILAVIIELHRAKKIYL
ncbi:MAG: hypothetical protein J6Y94_03580 [Bacteriovoracaceae bacterium]|nr:hypothetical protein [Bacteriovoracaceae bacterium]